jgi:hypothetical protein
MTPKETAITPTIATITTSEITVDLTMPRLERDESAVMSATPYKSRYLNPHGHGASLFDKLTLLLERDLIILS